MQIYPIFIATAPALVPYLQKELLSLGFSKFLAINAGIKLDGSFSDIMFLNLNLRCAHHVYLMLNEFKCNNPDELYKNIYSMPWENFIESDGYICVASNVINPTIRDSRYANLKCKDAIVDRLLKTTGSRPDSGSDRNKTVLYLYWKDNYCSIYLDASGETLSRRNYRKIPLAAPLQEALAAGIILATEWDTKTNFINPMCGSGTLAIEAVLIALNRAPGISRENFGFMHTKLFDANIWQEIKHDARQKENKKIDAKVIATDIDEKAIEASRNNASLADIEKYIEFTECDYPKTNVPDGGGIVVVNPGYGIRMGEIQELEKLYEGIGDFFKQKCSGYRGYIFSANIPLLKKVGLRPQKKMVFYNAEIECRLYEYALYAGTKRSSFKDSPRH
ncbi:MAG: class I SAM-dependent RNA methyltransferase [Candidatus Omnitrophota bacterium]|jgi:putative N6-adenine-specific DNA methylase